MSKKVVAIVGSYRKGNTVDSAVDAILDGARLKGAETRKIYLLDQHIEFCTNCRTCTQTEGAIRGKCVQNDDLDYILTEIETADAIILGAPVNFFDVTALFRRFMERLVCYSYWPWGKSTLPSLRSKALAKTAVLVTSTAMPGFLIPVATGAPRSLRTTARVLGARPIGKLWIGLSAANPRQPLSERTRNRARWMGHRLASS